MLRQPHPPVAPTIVAGACLAHVDGVLMHSGSGGFALAANRLPIGDGTGGTNAQGEITAYRFSQDLATPALPSTCGRLKELHTGRWARPAPGRPSLTAGHPAPG